MEIYKIVAKRDVVRVEETSFNIEADNSNEAKILAIRRFHIDSENLQWFLSSFDEKGCFTKKCGFPEIKSLKLKETNDE